MGGQAAGRAALPQHHPQLRRGLPGLLLRPGQPSSPRRAAILNHACSSRVCSCVCNRDPRQRVHAHAHACCLAKSLMMHFPHSLSSPLPLPSLRVDQYRPCRTSRWWTSGRTSGSAPRPCGRRRGGSRRSTTSAMRGRHCSRRLSHGARRSVTTTFRKPCRGRDSVLHMNSNLASRPLRHVVTQAFELDRVRILSVVSHTDGISGSWVPVRPVLGRWGRSRSWPATSRTSATCACTRASGRSRVWMHTR